MVIRFQDVLFSYPDTSRHADTAEVLNIPNWEVDSGAQVFIHGPSGCGKSTLLNLLSGMLLPTKGKLEIFGQSLNDLSARKRDRFRATQIGYIFQQYNLVPYLSPVDNIQLAAHLAGSKVDIDEIITLLQQLNISGAEHHRPVRHLSVGQQQRIAIARALINKPGLILADEPTSSLDDNNAEAFLSLLLDVASDKTLTTIFVSHDLRLSHHFSSVISMDQISTRER